MAFLLGRFCDITRNTYIRSLINYHNLKIRVFEVESQTGRQMTHKEVSEKTNEKCVVICCTTGDQSEQIKL